MITNSRVVVLDVKFKSDFYSMLLNKSYLIEVLFNVDSILKVFYEISKAFRYEIFRDNHNKMFLI